MKSPPFFLPLLLALLLTAAALAACGGGAEALTLEEYYQRIQQIGDESDAKFAELDAEQGPGEDASPQEIADFIRSITEGQVQILDAFIADLRDVDPPAEAEDIHAEAIGSGEAAARALQAHADRIPDALSASEAEAFFAEPAPELDAAFQRFTAACLAAQKLADDNNVQADLNCQEEQAAPSPTPS